MKTVIFLTSAYPYFPGEQFIEDEISYWAEQTSAKIILVPMTASGVPRCTPTGIDINLTLAQTSSFINKLISVTKAAFSKLFWKEVMFIYESKGLTLRCFMQALKSSANVIRIEKALKRILARYQRLDVAYCYWNEVQAYAAVSLKRVGLISKVVSRAHGFDVYEHRRPDNYMPLKRQFIREIDATLAISCQGKEYLELTYNLPAQQVFISPLGVPIPTMISLISETNRLNILSIAFCVSVKRIDKIIDAIAEAALQHKYLKINWTHIGDGPLLSSLKLRAAEKLNQVQVEWCFLGNKANAEVRRYFEENPVDIFINTSESEGVPVSIMEAMSYGVPVIAPNIGGIAELVSDEYGYMLSELPSVNDIATSIVVMSLRCKQAETRALAKQKIINNFSAKKNYQELVKLVLS